MVRTFNHSTQEAEAGKHRVQSQSGPVLGLHRVSQGEGE